MRGRRTRIVARIDDDTAPISVSWFNQPWLADKLTPGTQIRIRGKLGRFGFEPRSYDLGETRATADFAPVYPAAEEIAAASVRRVVDARPAARVERPRPAARGVARARGARAQARRARRRAPAARSRRGGTRPPAPRVRGAPRPPARHRAPRRGARADARRRPRRAGRPHPPLPRGAAVRAHAVPGAGDPRDRRRPRAHDADAAAPAGRRRLGQDRRRALRAPPRGRERPPGRAHGADRDARRAALPHRRRPLPRARRHVRAAHELVEEGRAGERARRRRRRRHARAHPDRRRAARPRGRRRRRAAPLRRRAALRHLRAAARRTSST